MAAAETATSQVDFRDPLLDMLKARNKRETDLFSPIVSKHHEMLLREMEVRRHNHALENEVAQLRMKNTEFREQQAQDGLIGGAVTVSSTKMAELEQELNGVREELTNSLKTNATTMKTMLELTRKLQEKAKEYSAVSEECEVVKLERDRALEIIEQLKQTLTEKDAAFEQLQQEKLSIRKDFLAKEQQCRKLKADYSALLDRWLLMKTEEAEKLNTMNELLESINKQKTAAEMVDKGKAEITDAQERLGPDSDLLAPSEMQTISICVLPTQMRRTYQGHNGEINCVAFSPIGNTFATGSNDKTVKLWDTRTGTVKNTLSGAVQSIMCVRFSMNEEMVLGASNDNATRVWSTNAGRLRHTLTGHVGKVYSAEFSMDSTKVVSGSHDRTIKLWDLARGFCTRTIFCFSSCNDLCLASDNSMICSGHYDGSIRLWDMNGECAHVFDRLHTKQITSVCLSPDRTAILTSGRDDILRIVDIRMHDTVQTFSQEGYHSGINWQRACFSPDGQYAVAGSSNGNVYIWNVLTGKCDTVLKPTDGKATVTSVAWSIDGQQLVSVDRNGFVTQWD